MNATKSWSSPWMRALWIEVASFGGEMTEETQGNLKLRVPMSRLEETEGLIKKLAERSCTIDIFCFSDGISCETRISSDDRPMFCEAVSPETVTGDK